MVKAFSEGLLGSNTYLYTNSGEGMIVDCGNPPQKIYEYCETDGITVRCIVLTHGHYDHAHYVNEYKELFPSAQTVAHRDETAVLNNPEANVSALFGEPTVYAAPDKAVADGDLLNVGDACFKVLHTPGHTPGGICLYCEKEKLMFTGDTLFCGGYGRTDFLYGDENALFSSLKRITSVSGDTVFYSGHGIEGRIEYEKYGY